MQDKIGIMGNGFVGNALYTGIKTFYKDVFMHDVKMEKNLFD